jgi:hypothetical protein
MLPIAEPCWTFESIPTLRAQQRTRFHLAASLSAAPHDRNEEIVVAIVFIVVKPYKHRDCITSGEAARRPIVADLSCQHFLTFHAGC